jgi:branched-chain amino acid transport system substrate-binding protein
MSILERKEAVLDTTRFTICLLGIILLTIIWVPVAAEPVQDEPIIIGALENRKYEYAEMMRRSFDLALKKINDRGGIYGRPIQLVYADDGGRKNQGIEAVKGLVRKSKAVMLVGGYSSSNTLFMAQTAEKLDTPFLVCTAADDRITQRKKINIFRMNPPAAEYTRGLESLINQRIKPASMAIVYENSPYGTSGALRMMYFCRENEIDVTAIIPYHKERAGADYFQRIISPLKGSPPDVIFMVSYMRDGVELVKQIHGAGLSSLLSGGAGGFTHPDFIQKAGKGAQHLLTATLWTSDQQDMLARMYADLYRSKYMQLPDYHGAEAYSAMMVVADVLRRARSFKAEDLRNALAQTDLSTPFGKISFESYGKYERQNREMTLVLQAVDERYQCVWPREVAVAEPILPAR